MCCGAVPERSERSGYGNGTNPSSIVLFDVAEVKHDSIRQSQAARAPRGRKRKVQLRWQEVGEVVQRERRLVGEDAFLLGPEPDRREVFMVAGRKWTMR